MTKPKQNKEEPWIMIIHNNFTINYVRNTSMWQRMKNEHWNDVVEKPIFLN